MAVTNLTGIEKNTNGREGTFSNKTLKSLQLISNGVHRFSERVESLSNEMKVRPSSLLAIKVENFHAVSHFKHPTFLQLEHARDLGATVLESAKI